MYSFRREGGGHKKSILCTLLIMLTIMHDPLPWRYSVNHVLLFVTFAPLYVASMSDDLPIHVTLALPRQSLFPEICSHTVQPPPLSPSSPLPLRFYPIVPFLYNPPLTYYIILLLGFIRDFSHFHCPSNSFFRIQSSIVLLKTLTTHIMQPVQSTIHINWLRCTRLQTMFFAFVLG